MQIVLVIPEYILWHYTRALRLTLNIVTNFVWFTYHFFSIPILLKTFFDPWYIAPPLSVPGSHPFLVTERFFLQTFMKFFGPIIRGIVVVLGFTLCILLSVFGFVLFVIWFFLPIIAITFFIGALYLFFS